MSLKKAYLYLASIISLVIAVVGSIMLINLALKAWVFTKADRNAYYAVACPLSIDPSQKPIDCNTEEQRKIDEENRSAQRQRDAAQALAMILVATPVWYYHWNLARKEV